MLNHDYLIYKDIGISIEWVHEGIGFVRGGPGKWEWKATGSKGKYQFTCLILVANDYAEIKGFLGFYNRDVRRALRKILNLHGIDKVTYERMNQDTRRVKNLDISR